MKWLQTWFTDEDITDSGLQATYFSMWNARSVLFNCLVVGELINAYNSRSEYGSLFKIGFLTNMALFWSVIISLALTVFIFYVPFAATIFQLVPLGWDEWLLSIAFATPVFFSVELLKIYYRKQKGIDFHMNVIER